VTATGAFWRLADDPAIENASDLSGIKALGASAAVHLTEARGVPQLGAEIANSPRSAGSESLMSRACPDMAVSVNRSASAPYSSTRSKRVHNIALGLGHLLALRVADQGVDEDLLERHFAA